MINRILLLGTMVAIPATVELATPAEAKQPQPKSAVNRVAKFSFPQVAPRPAQVGVPACGRRI